MTHLNRRGGTYWFRFRLPSDLRAKPVPEGWPDELASLVSAGLPRRFKSEITRSLCTKDEKLAKRRVAQAIAEAEHLCETARRFVAQGLLPATITPEQSAALANDYRAALLLIDAEVRKEGFGGGGGRGLAIENREPAPQEPGMTDADLAGYAEFVGERDAELRRAMASSRPPERTKRAAEARLKVARVSLPQGSPERRDVELDFLAAERRAMQDVSARLAGEIVPTPPLGVAESAHSGPTLREAFDRWAAGDPVRGAKKPGELVVNEGATILRRFVELHGNLSIAAITKRHARELLHALAKVPKGLPPELRKLSLTALLKRDLSKYAPRAAATVNKSMQVLGGVLARAEKDGHLDDVAGWTNPFHISIGVNEIDLEPYQPFDVHELNKLFASPVFANGVRPKGGRGEAAFWFPLLGLFTGARRTELAQLVVGDVRQDVDTGVWFIDFHNEGNNSLKTRASRRKTPIHPTLIALGLLDYARQRAEGRNFTAPLWPEFERPVVPKAKAWTKWFSRYLAAHVVDHPAKSFHSFRGTFKRFARATGCEEHVVDALVGHAGSSVGRRYGRREDASGSLDAGFPLARLGAEVARVEISGLKLP